MSALLVALSSCFVVGVLVGMVIEKCIASGLCCWNHKRKTSLASEKHKKVEKDPDAPTMPFDLPEYVSVTRTGHCFHLNDACRSLQGKRGINKLKLCSVCAAKDHWPKMVRRVAKGGVLARNVVCVPPYTPVYKHICIYTYAETNESTNALMNIYIIHTLSYTCLQGEVRVKLIQHKHVAGRELGAGLLFGRLSCRRPLQRKLQKLQRRPVCVLVVCANEHGMPFFVETCWIFCRSTKYLR